MSARGITLGLAALVLLAPVVGAVPSEPVNVRATVTSDVTGATAPQVTLTWEPPVDDLASVTGYVVHKSGTVSDVIELANSVTFEWSERFQAGESYNVSALYQAGGMNAEGPASATVTPEVSEVNDVLDSFAVLFAAVVAFGFVSIGVALLRRS